MTELIKITTDDPAFMGTWERPDRHEPKREGMALLFIALLAITAVTFTFIGSRIEKDRPIVDDPGFVNIEGHQGEVLVVRDDMTVEWTTEVELHEAAGHG